MPTRPPTSRSFAVLLALLASRPMPAAEPPAEPGAPGDARAAPTEGCGRHGCTSCGRTMAVCVPKWQDKKTKRPVLSLRCEPQCVRPWEPFCQGDGCEERTTPCGEVRTRKRLYKATEERTERVLTYEVDIHPAPPACAPGPPPAPACRCLGCRCLGQTVGRLLHW